MTTNLLQHVRTERGPVSFDELLHDCRFMQHAPQFPRDEADLREQLRALVRAGLVTWDEEAGVVQAVGERLPATLF